MPMTMPMPTTAHRPVVHLRRPPLVVYLAGPYSGGVAANIAAARAVAIEVWRRGHIALCPHLNTAHFEDDLPRFTHADWLRGDRELLCRCDAILLLPGWDHSPGAIEEHAVARAVGIPVVTLADLERTA